MPTQWYDRLWCFLDRLSFPAASVYEKPVHAAPNIFTLLPSQPLLFSAH